MSSTDSNNNTSKVHDKKITPKPSAEKPAPPKPSAEKPAPPKPSAEKPAPPKPSAEKPAPPKPSAEKPAPPKPSAEKPAPQKPEETLPAFEKDLTDRIANQFSDDVEIGYVKENRTRINVKKEKILDVAKFIKEQTPFDHAESVSGVDYPEDKEIEVVYHLASYTDNRYAKQILALSTRAPREEDPNPGNDSTRLPSLRDVFYSVEFHERECFEMLGVYFDGHPDNRRLLLPEDWADLPPLRKDFRNKGR